MHVSQQYVEHRESSYIIEKPGTVYRLNRDSTTSRITDQKVIYRIMARHRVISEAEALIIAYSETTREEQKQARPVATATAGEPPPRPAKQAEEQRGRRARQAFVAIMAAIIGVNLMAVLLRGTMVSFLEFALILMVLPALTFGVAFVLVCFFFLYLVVIWVVVKLKNRWGLL